MNLRVRKFLLSQLIRLAHALAAVAIVTSAVEAADARKPNVVLIVADDLGYNDVGFHGGKEIATPNLDRLAGSGVKFTNGYVTCPVCSPTRAGLATARYQQRFGHEFNTGGEQEAKSGTGLPLTEKTIAQVLKEGGYATGHVGKWHLGFSKEYWPNSRGFDESFGFLGGAHPYQPGEKGPTKGIFRNGEPVDEREYLTDAFGREAVAYIERHAEHPFFLYLAFNAVHNPQQATDKYLDRVAKIEKQERKTYAAMLTALDENVGKVLKAIEDKKLDEHTLIFFVADNGGPTQANFSDNHPLNGNKGSVWEGGIRVPFVASWKGRLPAGKAYDQPVISLDIPATIAAVTGASLPSDRVIDGVDLIPFVTDQKQGEPHDALFWRFGPQHAVRRGNFKLVKFGEEPEQLFDLSADIAENNNLASSKPEIVSDLSQLYAKWDSELAEPLWQTGGRANPQRLKALQDRTQAKKEKPSGKRRQVKS